MTERDAKTLALATVFRDCAARLKQIERSRMQGNTFTYRDWYLACDAHRTASAQLLSHVIEGA